MFTFVRLFLNSATKTPLTDSFAFTAKRAFRASSPECRPQPPVDSWWPSARSLSTTRWKVPCWRHRTSRTIRVSISCPRWWPEQWRRRSLNRWTFSRRASWTRSRANSRDCGRWWRSPPNWVRLVSSRDSFRRSCGWARKRLSHSCCWNNCEWTLVINLRSAQNNTQHVKIKMTELYILRLCEKRRNHLQSLQHIHSVINHLWSQTLCRYL